MDQMLLSPLLSIDFILDPQQLFLLLDILLIKLCFLGIILIILFQEFLLQVVSLEHTQMVLGRAVPLRFLSMPMAKPVFQRLRFG